MSAGNLEERFRAAHAQGDTGALVTLYARAADGEQCADAAGFYLTLAYVYALEAGLPAARDLQMRLAQAGREEPTGFECGSGRGA